MSDEKKPKYINPLTDFGFKRIFGTEANSDLLMDFLNCMLPLKSPIAKITYKNVEQIPNLEDDRKVIYDLFCVDEEGNELIIEMQKARLTYFRDRSLFYLTFPIQSQSVRGSWNFKLSPIYYLSLLDFYYEPEHTALLEREVQLKDQQNEVFYPKLFLKYVQLPVFQKAETELSDRKEQWLYYLKHLEEMEQIPQIFKSDKIFIKGLKIAEIAALSEPEFQTYQLSRMQYLEIRGVVETAYDEGILDAEKKYIPLLTEAQEIAEEERRQKEEERRQKEEERRQKEHLFQKQRKLILKMLSEGESQANVAAFFEISEAELAEIIKE